jgi:citrate lyase subunit beta / citryl-CoA lyase
MGTPPATERRASMPMRSMLFVPGDSEKKLAKGTSAGADALILDLEDSVDVARKPAARGLVAEFLAAHDERIDDAGLWVRINPIDDAQSELDLDSIVPCRPDGIVLPKARGVDDALKLGAALDDLEHRHEIPVGSTRMLVIATETPAALFALDGYRRAWPRLAALTWGAEDLSVAVGAATSTDDDGRWLPPYQWVRSLCIFAAAAAGVQAIDTVYTRLRDADGLSREAAAAKRDGFTGKLAIHPDQVEILNRAFLPGGDEIDEARRIVEAFERAGRAGAVAFEGRMLDQPHLTRARRVLELAAHAGGRR